jgi:hypothetical protein
VAKDKDKDKEEVIKYRVHDMAAVFPLPGPEEYAAIKEHVEQVGFIYPKVFWKDAKDEVWLIDGRTRDRIETELAKAGKAEAANGAELKCRAVYFEGTESEAVHYVRGLNLSRRSMNKGQKAAAAILSGALFKRYKAKEDGKDAVDDDAEEESGDMATRVAREAGTNRAYVFDCAKLHRENPDLLLRVLSGDLSIPNAKKIAGRRKDGLSDEPEDGGEEPVEVAPDDGPEVLLDGLRNEVAPELVDVFKYRKAVKAAKKAVGTAVSAIEADNDGPGASNVSFQSVKADANNFIRHLEDHQPHAPCPYCMGTGKAGDPDQPHKRCGECKGKRFLDRLQWKQVPEELRALFEKKPGKGGDDDTPHTPAEVPADIPADAGDVGDIPADGGEFAPGDDAAEAGDFHTGEQGGPGYAEATGVGDADADSYGT